MLYRIYATEAEAKDAQQLIYASFLRQRAAMNSGQLDDWSNSLIVPFSIDGIADPELIGTRFPLYGQRASDMVFITEHGHTTAWAAPVQINDGRWVFPSPDDTGEEPGDGWFAGPALE